MSTTDPAQALETLIRAFYEYYLSLHGDEERASVETAASVNEVLRRLGEEAA